MKMISLDSIPERSADEKEIDRIIQAGRTAAISWMGLARKSSGRVRDYLNDKGFDQQAVTLIIASLQDDRTLDDERLARKIIKQRQGSRPESRLALASRLANMGIDATVIEDVLSCDQQFEQDQQSASIIFHQRFGRLADELKEERDQFNDLEFKRKCAQLAGKAARFLSSRGFSDAIIIDTLRQAGLLTNGFE